MGEPTIVIEKNVPTPMRDGTVLRADVFRPAAPGKYPVILQRTPYNKNLTTVGFLMLDVMRVVGEGYVVVIQDTRGRSRSDGAWYPLRPEADDLHHVLDLLQKMDRREATVLRMRFGLDDEEPKTLKQIGECLGLTRERVRQIENEALSKLSESMHVE